MEVYDSKTGEILEIKGKFQTPYDLDKVSVEHFDPEKDPKAQSMTEPNQAPNIEALYKRCLRGEVIPNRQGGYDVAPGASFDEAAATLDPTESEGFDLADVTAISEAVKSDLSTQQAEADKSKSSDGAEVVGKSTTQPSDKVTTANTTEAKK